MTLVNLFYTSCSKVTLAPNLTVSLSQSMKLVIPVFPSYKDNHKLIVHRIDSLSSAFYFCGKSGSLEM